jgi:hypothetical protein
MILGLVMVCQICDTVYVHIRVLAELQLKLISSSVKCYYVVSL